MAKKHGRSKKDRSILEGEAVVPFRAAIRSEFTRLPYERRLATFLESIGMNLDAFIKKSGNDVKWAQSTIMKYLLYQKERVGRKEIQASTLSGIKKPLKLVLEMNDIQGVNWNKINRMLPAFRNYALDRAPTFDEIRLLLGNSEPRFQAILLLLLSSGIRVGACEALSADEQAR